MKPANTTEEFLHPGQVRVGDLFEFDGAWYPVQDMVSGNGGTKILHFLGKAPYVMSQPEIVYRPMTHTGTSKVWGSLLPP
ncbi:hypothetical protein V7793_05145 [Streptomyces sp. KLMMK]|uniref:hypothetical protein n=1 Tax=Streptomyces sp. KLMMK TaxID=3109353 RepID=UPI00300020B2